MKEKNLTIEDYTKMVHGHSVYVNADGHKRVAPMKPITKMGGQVEKGEQLRPTSVELGAYIMGPAIDRLHEFEKLGMEPEEIMERINELYTKYTELFINHTNIEVAVYEQEQRYKQAIDRLRKFERFGMEPEDFERMVKNHKASVRYANDEDHVQVDGKQFVSLELFNNVKRYLMENLEVQKSYNCELHDTIADLQEQITFLEETIEKFGVEESKRNIDELKREIEKMQADNIAELQEEIEKASQREVEKMKLEIEVYELKQENANLENRLREKTEEYGVKITAMAQDMDNLEHTIEGLKQENEILSKELAAHGVTVVYEKDIPNIVNLIKALQED